MEYLTDTKLIRVGEPSGSPKAVLTAGDVVGLVLSLINLQLSSNLKVEYLQIYSIFK